MNLSNIEKLYHRVRSFVAEERFQTGALELGKGMAVLATTIVSGVAMTEAGAAVAPPKLLTTQVEVDVHGNVTSVKSGPVVQGEPNYLKAAGLALLSAATGVAGYALMNSGDPVQGPISLSTVSVVIRRDDAAATTAAPSVH